MGNISEPVLTIARLLKDSPERFTMTDGSSGYYRIVEVYDTVTKKEFQVMHGYDCTSAVLGSHWMTPDEGKFLGRVVVKVLQEKIAREKNAVADKERKEWLSAYKEDIK